MAEFDAYETIEEAHDGVAKGAVKKSNDSLGNGVELISLKELAEAEQRRAGRVAAGKPHFGMRMTRLVPPGTG